MTSRISTAPGGLRQPGSSDRRDERPIAWHVENIAVVTRQIQGKPYDGQTFTVVLKNVSDRTLTFTRYDETRYAPGINPLIRNDSGEWVLRPGQNWRLDRFSFITCSYGGGCLDSGASHTLSRFIFTGRDDQGRPVKAQLDITLPPAATGPMPIR